ncbi:MAG: FkbM family methyltransferase [Actinomycetes bacterium]
MIHSLLNSIHELLGRSRRLTRAAVLLRNQCTQVIRSGLAPSASQSENGETLLIDAVAAHVKRAVDVGAHLGGWAAPLLTAAEDAQILMFEPQPEYAARLRERFGSRTEVVEAALGDRPGYATLFGGDVPTHASLVDEVGTAIGQVVVSTLDIEAEKRDWSNIDFVKIDSEGFDLHVLRGASGLLAGQRIGIVQFEYNRQWMHAGSTLTAARAFLAQHGYDVYLVRYDGLYEFDYKRFGEFFTYSNFVAISPQASSWIDHLRRGAY